MHPKVEKRFAKAVLSSGLLSEEELERALGVQEYAAQRGRALPLDRVLLKLNLLTRDEILGLWRALRYYVWRKEDKFFVKLAIQSKLLTEKLARTCLKAQKKAYKTADELIRVNEIARQRGYLTSAQDRAIVDAMKKIRPVSLLPADEGEGAGFEVPSPRAASKDDGEAWKGEARSRDLTELRSNFGSSAEMAGVSDEDLDALWEEADLDDVELDSQAFEMARGPLLDEEDEEDDDLFDLL